MKKNYTTPTIEKIAFRYRDQVVAASGDGAGNGGAGEVPSNPGFGQVTDANWNQNGCKLHMFEAAGWNVCDYL